MAQDTQTGIAGWNANMGARSRAHRSAGEKRRRVGLLVTLCALCAACLVCAWTPKDQIARGLWLKGGTAVTLTAQDSGSEALSPEQLSQAASTIERRLELIGVSESRVSVKDDGTLTIDLPWDVDALSLAQEVGGAGTIEFVRVDQIGDADALAKINAGTTNVALQAGTYTPFIEGGSITSASVTEVSSGVYAVTFTLDDEAGQAFADTTRELAENSGRIAIVVDGRVVSAPSVSQEITGGQVSITSDFSETEANALKALVDTEALPASFDVTSSEEVGPLVGSATLWVMVAVVAVTFVAVSIVGYLRLKRLGLLVAGAFVVYVCMVLGSMALFSRLNMFTLTLAGVVGGTLTGVGALVAVWRIASRFQALVQEGTSVKGAASSAVLDAVTPLRMPCVLGFILALIFLFVPLPVLRGLGLMVIMGGVCGLTAVFWFGVTMLRLLAMGTIQNSPEAWGVHRA